MTVERIGQLTAEDRFFGNALADGSDLPDLSSTKVMTGSYSYRFGSSTDAIGLLVPATDQVRAGYWLNHLGFGVLTITKGLLFLLVNENADRFIIRWNFTNDLIEILNESTVVASVAIDSTLLPRDDTWMHIGMNFKNGADGWFTLYIDGEETLTYSGDWGVDQIIAAYGTGQGSTSGGWTNYAYMDDFYVDDTTGESDTPPSSKRFLWMAPTADGASSEFTPEGDTDNYLCVDEVTPDGDTTYNKSLITGDLDLFEMGGITIPEDYVIRAVLPTAIARKSDAGTIAQIILKAFDGINTEASNERDVNFAYNTYFERFPLQPDGSPWNETDASAMQYGYESVLV